MIVTFCIYLVRAGKYLIFIREFLSQGIFKSHVNENHENSPTAYLT